MKTIKESSNRLLGTVFWGVVIGIVANAVFVVYTGYQSSKETTKVLSVKIDKLSEKVDYQYNNISDDIADIKVHILRLYDDKDNFNNNINNIIQRQDRLDNRQDLLEERINNINKKFSYYGKADTVNEELVLR